MIEANEPMLPGTTSGVPVDNLAFSDFSTAFDEVRAAYKAFEGLAPQRLANPLAPEVTAAQNAFLDAGMRYNAIVAALIKPKF